MQSSSNKADTMREEAFSLKAFIQEQSAKTHKEFNQQKTLVKNIALILCVSSYAAIAVGLFLLSSVSLWVSGLLIIEAIITGSVYLIAYFLARSSGSVTHLKRAIYLMLLTLFLAVSAGQLLLGSGGGMSAAFLIVAVLANIAGLGVREVTITSITGIVLMQVFLFLENGLRVYTPALSLTDYPLIDALLWLIVALVICVGFTIFTYRTTLTNKANATLAASKTQALLKLQATMEMSTALTREVNQTISELSATSNQQASGAQEQASATGQIGASMEELGETANQIANSARGAVVAANQVVVIGEAVQEASIDSQQRAQEGNQAVEEAITSVDKVRHRIELLGQRLLNLTEQVKRVTAIIVIIDEIADETHLLALNASIEAAGEIRTDSVDDSAATTGVKDYRGNGNGSIAILNGSSISSSSNKIGRRGERFGVIAQEVKSLADRSRELTEEVRQAVSEMQGALAAAVLVAEEGKKATTEAVARAQIAGAVIARMNGNVEGNLRQFEQVLNMAGEVKQRCEEISLATNQQKSANVQIVYTIHGLADVARQTANGAAQTSVALNSLNLKVAELNDLTNSSEANDEDEDAA